MRRRPSDDGPNLAHGAPLFSSDPRPAAGRAVQRRRRPAALTDGEVALDNIAAAVEANTRVKWSFELLRAVDLYGFLPPSGEIDVQKALDHPGECASLPRRPCPNRSTSSSTRSAIPRRISASLRFVRSCAASLASPTHNPMDGASHESNKCLFPYGCGNLTDPCIGAMRRLDPYSSSKRLPATQSNSLDVGGYGERKLPTTTSSASDPADQPNSVSWVIFCPPLTAEVAAGRIALPPADRGDARRWPCCQPPADRGVPLAVLALPR